MKILFAGGGSGGHIFPIIAVAREIRKIYPQAEFFYVGPESDFSGIDFINEEIKVKFILAGKNRRYFTFGSFFSNLSDFFIKIPIGTLQSFFHIFLLGPDVIFSKGGYGAVPVTLAGWFLRVPIFLQESDSVPGAANKFASSFAREIFVSFSKTPYFHPGKMILVGNPIRRELLDGTRAAAMETFKLRGGKPVILIFGGSQGSQRINDEILENLSEMLKSFELIHQTGEKNFEQLKKEAQVIIKKGLEVYYHPVPFLREGELRDAYCGADLIISRAGAGSIFEIAASGKPSILVPLPESAQDHQLKNAYNYAACGAAIAMEEKNFTSHFLLERLRYIFSQQQEIQRMSQAALEFARPLAAKIIAEYIVSYLTA